MPQKPPRASPIFRLFRNARYPAAVSAAKTVSPQEVVSGIPSTKMVTASFFGAVPIRKDSISL
jgi:hypothetical protein